MMVGVGPCLDQSVWEKYYNKLVGRRRYKIERVLESIKRWWEGVNGTPYRPGEDPRPACVGGL